MSLCSSTQTSASVLILVVTESILIEDAFDIAFRMGSLEDAGFIARKLLDIERNTASPEYFARKGKPVTPKTSSIMIA